MTVTTSRKRSNRSNTFDSLAPATGEVVGTFPIHDEGQVREAVQHARKAAQWWQSLGFDGRRKRLSAFTGILTRRREELLDLIARETGKPQVDALIEHVLAVEHLDWAAKNARRLMKPRKVAGSMLLANVKPILEYQPLGVVGVIGPWNYPLFTPMGSIGYALAAGNAVVFKPSELTPAVGVWLAEAFREAVPEQPVLQVVTGFGDTGAALCRAGVDKIAFTGSAPTGRKIMAACAETLTPVLLELGGKDAMLVDADADVTAAANAALWGACANAGQTCVGIERVYVVDAVYDKFVTELTAAARDVKAGGDAPLIGPMTMPKQLDIVREHIDEALDQGARALVGGRESVHEPFIDPVILVDVPEDTRVMREETFGPVLPVTRVRDLDEAVEKANRSAYGLGAAVFGKRHGYDAARRLRSGMTSVNTVLAFAGFPALPFGGVGESGFGRIHGEDGLKEFTRAKAIAKQRFATPANIMSFNRPTWLPNLVKKLGELRFGRRGR
ncbi:MAG TPA: aldehyde dehydrogenase family protein [Mycobacteriales bacterium]|nr:aldehyde dehydrogenase family protein [Mycobacteriales bacterium]